MNLGARGMLLWMWQASPAWQVISPSSYPLILKLLGENAVFLARRRRIDGRGIVTVVLCDAPGYC